jgi:hypothetical protein
MAKWIAALVLLLSHVSHADTFTRLQEDLKNILSTAQLPTYLVSFDFTNATPAGNQVSVQCWNSQITLHVSAAPEESVSTFYYGLHKLGFLFPHPRRQISPTLGELNNACGKVFNWRPSIERRGFHLHTEHPNEWISGFYEGNEKIARETLYWLARNFQNVVQLQMIRADDKKLSPAWKRHYALAHDLGIEFGLVASYSSQQQHSRSLIPLLNAITGAGDSSALRKSIQKLAGYYDFDFMVLQTGTSEFTPTDYKRTLKWLDESCNTLKGLGKKMYAVAHVSTGQSKSPYGNFNFLPQFSSTCVGVQVHSVMFYSLDDHAPVYGRKDFEDVKRFALEQNSTRETWYYPETSYFIGMDIDMPLMLTDYLRARAEDYAWTVKNGLTGHVTFTTGQELGYWLFDWNVALQADSEYLGDPLAGVKLLDEDPATWQKILGFQTEYFVRQQGVQMLSTSNLLDELFPGHSIHVRNLLRVLATKPKINDGEVSLMKAMISHLPDLTNVHDAELKALLEITWARIYHAFYLRQALASGKDRKAKQEYVTKAHAARVEALKQMKTALNYQHYSDSLVFKKQKNETSYHYGYGWPAANLYFWQREEEMVKRSEFGPFFMNLYSIIDLIF